MKIDPHPTETGKALVAFTNQDEMFRFDEHSPFFSKNGTFFRALGFVGIVPETYPHEEVIPYKVIGHVAGKLAGGRSSAPEVRALQADLLRDITEHLESQIATEYTPATS